ncbi:TnsD family Tn7-like transposition protein, partial [Coleofasciculus sp. FACHB-SPT36]|uniref:TnsD family Tn7-like transposition protein n=2 Tax=Cyanophyceae TaxID=3028117 RepID=UPI00168AF969
FRCLLDCHFELICHSYTYPVAFFNLVHLHWKLVLESYRMAWLEAVKENPHIGRTTLERMFQSIYSWLYIYDQQWLQAHLPPRKRRVKFSPQVDWNQRDIKFAAAARQSAQRLQSFPQRPTKVTKTAIASDLGQLRLIQPQKDKLPCTTKALEELAETREEFAIRRIQWASECFREENVYPKRWQLLRQAGIRPDLAEAPQVKEAITLALKSLDPLDPVNIINLLCDS